MISLKNVTKIYGAKNLAPTLSNINLEIQSGELVAIVGASGSGKSTLLNLIGTMDTPTSGEITIAGERLGNLNNAQLSKLRGEKIGFIFQSFNLLPTLTALENIMVPMYLMGKTKHQANNRALALLKLVNLDARAHHLPDEMSGGERQRVAIARCLANEPAIILADEPTGNLDSKNSAIIMELIARLHEKTQVTIIIVSHSDQVANMCKRVITVKDGAITQDICQ